MKKTLTLLALFLIPFLSHAYVPMLKKGYEWAYANPSPRGPKYYLYHLDTDTVMNNSQYYRMKCSSKDIYHADRYLLRENVDEQRVYIYSVEEAREYLLYDFSLAVGDSVQVFVPNNCSAEERSQLSWIYIVKVDTVVDLFGDTLRIFSYNTLSEVLPPNEQKHWRGGRYFERYGAVTGFLETYNEIVSYYVAGYCTPYQICGFDENGQLGNRNGGEKYDCIYEQIKADMLSADSSDIEENNVSQPAKTSSTPKSQEKVSQTETPSAKEQPKPAEKTRYKSTNLKKCSLKLEKHR